MTKPLQRSKLKKNLFRLLAARRALMEVELACHMVKEWKLDERHPIGRLLMTTISVTYARPFSANESLGPLRSEYTRFDDPALTGTHKILIDARNQIYAHNDISKQIPHPETKIPEPVFGLVAQEYEGRWEFGTNYLNLRASQVPSIEILCTELLKRIRVEVDSLTSLLSQGLGKPEGQKFLRLNDES